MEGIDHTAASARWGVPADHLPGVYALLLAPLVIWLIIGTLRVAARYRIPGSTRFIQLYDAATLPLRASVWLTLTTGLVHLAILPGHASEEPNLAFLFGIDVVSLAIASVGMLFGNRWRIATAGLLLANVVVYLAYVGSGREAVDQLGIATKLVELAAFGLLIIPNRNTIRTSGRAFRWTAAAIGLVVITIATGAITWTSTVRAARSGSDEISMSHDHDAMDHSGMTGMVMQSVPEGPPTPEQAAAAAKLAADTSAGIAKYADLNVALADGYRASTPPTAPMTHYSSRDFNRDGRILDPTRPETLVYANTPDGPLLLGAMYSMPKLLMTGPDVGGPLTVWHVHSNVCFSPLPPHLAGLVSTFGTCPTGSFNIVTAAMMHVWTVDWQGGPFGEMTPDDVATIVADH